MNLKIIAHDNRLDDTFDVSQIQFPNPSAPEIKPYLLDCQNDLHEWEDCEMVAIEKQEEPK